MTKLPRLTGKKVLSALNRAGFQEIRVKGSHHFLKHQDGRCTAIPIHSGETIGCGLLNKILSDCEITIEEFIQFLKA